MKLSDSVTTLKFISGKYAELLQKLDIHTVKDLLTYFPFKYVDTSEITSIKEMLLGEDFTKIYQIQGKVSGFRNGFIGRGRSIQSAKLSDESGNIKVNWFNQPFLENSLKNGREFILSGRVKKGKSGFTFYANYYEEVKTGKDTVHLARITPEYYLTAGLSKKWLRNRIKDLIDHIDKMEIPDELNSKDLKSWLKNVHFPETFDSLDEAIKNLALYEFTNIQLHILQTQSESHAKPTPKLNGTTLQSDYKGILKTIPFTLTKDQQSVVENLLKAVTSGQTVNSLIQGDVGSGKTIIAFILAYVFAKQGFQTVILAPTTILAKQHYLNFTKLLEDETIEVELVSSENKDSITQDILVGTSAVLARKTNLIKNLALVIVDEQHRFGVSQREELLKPLEDAIDKQKFYPHFINMTDSLLYPQQIAYIPFDEAQLQAYLEAIESLDDPLEFTSAVQALHTFVSQNARVVVITPDRELPTLKTETNAADFRRYITPDVLNAIQAKANRLNINFDTEIYDMRLFLFGLFYATFCRWRNQLKRSQMQTES